MAAINNVYYICYYGNEYSANNNSVVSSHSIKAARHNNFIFNAPWNQHSTIIWLSKNYSDTSKTNFRILIMSENNGGGLYA